MKHASDELIQYLQSEQSFLMADLYEFQLVDGTTLRYSTFDADFLCDGRLYSSTGPIIRRSRTRCVIGVEVDTLNLEVVPGPNDLLLGAPWLQAVGVGALDGATLALYRIFLQPDLSVVGGITLFVGQVADIQITRTLAKLTVNSAVQMLNVKLPRNVWQPGCLHTLYDADCAIDRDDPAIATETTVQSGSTNTALTSGLALVEARWFEQGYVHFLSGALTGVRRTIKSCSGDGVFQLLLPLPSIPAVGDAFKAYPGCDKTQATCTNKFHNVRNFRGFPYIPVAETAI
ncbi:MAG: DUF2163 domain-containing protein [Magnetococcales bacterium]|nr:DUF2163 domain-containing protein [Magnetococcales bacterium]